MANMTRAEAVCAANNILDLAEELNEKLEEKFPNNYYESVTSQAQSMKERIVANAQYAHITENMDGWFRRTWAGLRRWDHDDEFNDELFYGLSDVILELEKKDEDNPDAAPASASTKKQKGRESADDTMNRHVSKETQERARAAQEAAREEQEAKEMAKPRAADKPAVGIGNDEFKKQVQNETVARFKESVVRMREERISDVLSQVVARNIRLVDKSVIHHCDIEHILKKTSSDRTQQLIMAAFLAGKISGIHDLSSELKRSV